MQLVIMAERGWLMRANDEISLRRANDGPALIICQGSLTLAWHSHDGYLNHARLQ